MLIIEGLSPEKVQERRREDVPDAKELIQKYIDEGLKGKEISRLAADTLGISKNSAYELFLKIKAEQ